MSATRPFDGSAVAVATSVMNIATYGFAMLAARIIGPSQYGALVACLGLLIVIQVGALGLQATAARRIAQDGGNVAAIQHAILALAVKVSLAMGLAMLALVPVTALMLNLDSWLMAGIVAAAVVPLTLAGAQAGVLQGERRWGALAAFYLASGVPRLVIGTGLILWRPTATAALLGVAIGLVFPVLVGWWVLRNPRETGGAASEHSASSMLAESGHNAQVLFAYFALSSVDILLARRILSEHDAGLYAAGLIMAKVMLFMPQFVVVIAFPDMASPESRHRALTSSLLIVAALGVVAAVSAKFLSGLAMFFVGGAEFGEVEPLLWVFAVLGTVLAMLQLQVYAVLARQGRWSAVLLWGALLILVVLGLRADSLKELVTVVLAVDCVLLVALTGLSLRLARTPVAHEEPAPADV